MGSLFSSPEPTVYHPPPPRFDYHEQQRQEELLQRQRTQLQERRRQQELLQRQKEQELLQRQRSEELVLARKLNVRKADHCYSDLITTVLLCSETKGWTKVNYDTQILYFVGLQNSSSEYQSINNLFRKTNKRHFQITKIDRIQNPYLMCAFLLKKLEVAGRLGYEPKVRNLFHGTRWAAVTSICEGNFDWRKHGVNKGVKFGKGVSFSPISNYATHYSDQEDDGKVMLLTKVLVGKECLGEQDMLLPYGDCDTSKKENGHVIVKYEDNEFYPAYRLTYSYCA